MVKNPPVNAGDAGSISGWGRSPGEGKSNPLQYSCTENSLVGNGPRGDEELDTTERLNNSRPQIKNKSAAE